MINTVIQLSYLLAALLFIVGLRRMSSPLTARGGIVWAGWGMLFAIAATFLTPAINHYALIVLAILMGGSFSWYSGKRVAMTDMPQMIAIYNGMGGGAAAAIAALALMKNGHSANLMLTSLALLGALIGAIAFSGSLIAFLKLQGWINRALRVPFNHSINSGLLLLTVAVGIASLFSANAPLLLGVFFLLSLLFGVTLTLPIGGANMPLIISLFNAFTGLAVACEGFVCDNVVMMVAGTVVGASGTMLTQLMAKAMNRSIATVLFNQSAQGGHTAATNSDHATGDIKTIDVQDAGIMMAYANKVIVVPGYGLAVAQAQHKIWELAKRLSKRGVKIKFAIHPVAGRMPGHMNVLLAEAGVPYDNIFDLDEINEEFASADVALIIGANDVVNPVARTHPDSPIYGMPILNVDQAKNVVVIKRGAGKGFSGVENGLFYLDKTRMLYGDGQDVAQQLTQVVSGL